MDIIKKASISDNFYFDQILVKKKEKDEENQKEGIIDTKDI